MCPRQLKITIKGKITVTDQLSESASLLCNAEVAMKGPQRLPGLFFTGPWEFPLTQIKYRVFINTLNVRLRLG